ncbi:peptide/nickel transport system ATP-binding protein [Bradyrhizobium sp. USDA 328]
MSAPFVQATNLRRVFDVSKPWLNRVLEGGHLEYLKAVDGVTFDIRKGETFALVGESGSGKTTVARMVVGLLPPSSGDVLIDGVSMTDPRQAPARRKLRRRIQMIFQDPYASLNPRFRVDAIISEPIRAFDLIQGERDIQARVGELLSLVGLHPDDRLKFPHEFSGGQRQRIAIARALASDAEFIVCDEPTSALDVSVQAQILNLMRDLQDKFGLTYMFISHNLAVVRHMASRVGVMYLGRIVEIAEGRELFARPAHALHQDAAGRGARSCHERPPAHSGQGRDPEPDQPAPGLRLQSTLSARVRSLPQGDPGTDRRRRLPRRQHRTGPGVTRACHAAFAFGGDVAL